MPSFAKILSSALLVALFGFASIAAKSQKADVSDEVRAVRDDDVARRHLTYLASAHEHKAPTRFARAVRSPSRPNREEVERSFSDGAKAVVDQRALRGAAEIEERQLFNLVHNIVGEVTSAIPKAINFLMDALNCGAIGIICPHDYTGIGTPACAHGHCTLICPASHKYRLQIGAPGYCI